MVRHRLTRPSGLAIEPGVLVPSTVVAAVASALSLHVFARFGVVPGAELLAVAVSAGVGLLPRFKWARGSDRRLLLQTAATAATISTALTFMLPLGIAFSLKVANQDGLILLGTGLAAGVALLSLRWLSDSALMP